MAQLTVGINENVILKNVVFTDKKWIQLTFASLDNQKPFNPFEALASEDVVVQQSDLDINLFPPKAPTKEEYTAEKKVEFVTRDINRTKAILLHIARTFLTKEVANFGGKIYDGTGIDETGGNFNEKIIQNSVLEVVQANMANMFISWCKEHNLLNDPEKAIRLKLVRQSKDKHFATLPSSYLEENPFMELMTIPLAATKVKFTDYEIREGLDNSKPASKDTADKPTKDAGPAPTAETVFG